MGFRFYHVIASVRHAFQFPFAYVLVPVCVSFNKFLKKVFLIKKVFNYNQKTLLSRSMTLLFWVFEELCKFCTRAHYLNTKTK
ncbi:unnamed protein product, partial [Nesidiocoris tenuis]